MPLVGKVGHVENVSFLQSLGRGGDALFLWKMCRMCLEVGGLFCVEFGSWGWRAVAMVV